MRRLRDLLTDPRTRVRRRGNHPRAVRDRARVHRPHPHRRAARRPAPPQWAAHAPPRPALLARAHRRARTHPGRRAVAGHARHRERRRRRRAPCCMAEEQLDYALGDRPRFVVPRLRRGDRQEVHYSVRSHVRGRHRLGPLGVRPARPVRPEHPRRRHRRDERHPRAAPDRPARRRPAARAAASAPRGRSPTWSPCTARTTCRSGPTATATTCAGSTGRRRPRPAS